MNVSVRVYHSEESGCSGADDVPADLDVGICTIEKANMLVNGMLEKRTERSVLSMVVIDEMVSE
jgi:hypothetical protein